MIVTDCNKCSINELEVINRTTNIVFEINDGEIVNTLKEIAGKNNTFVSNELTSSISDGTNTLPALSYSALA